MQRGNNGQFINENAKLKGKCKGCGIEFEKYGKKNRSNNFCSQQCYFYYINRQKEIRLLTDWFKKLSDNSKVKNESENGYLVKIIGGKRYYAHRIEMMKKLKRSLKDQEQVHHIDGNKKNNSWDNLELMDISEHATHHSTKPFRKCTVVGCDMKHYAKGLCRKHYKRKDWSKLKTDKSSIEISWH